MSALQPVSFSAQTLRRSLDGLGTGVPSMTSNPQAPKPPSEHATAPSVDEPSDAPRLQLKPGPPAAAHLDGVWWPRSRTLTTEVPQLLDELHDRVGPVALVGYHSNAWEFTPAAVNDAAQSVHFQGFTSENPHTLIVVGTDGRRVALLVVPPDTTEAAAHRTLSEASRPTAADEDSGNDDISGSLDELATRLADRTGNTSAAQTATIADWVQEAGEQFVDAPIQMYVPILVEHLVRDKIAAQHNKQSGDPTP